MNSIRCRGPTHRVFSGGEGRIGRPFVRKPKKSTRDQGNAISKSPASVSNPALAPAAPPTQPQAFQRMVHASPAQPTFTQSMTTYFALGIGVTIGVVVVRVLTGMEGDDEANDSNS